MRFDPDELAASAVDGTDVTVTDDDRATLDAFRRVVGIGRTLTDADRATDDPPADLWDRISASLAADAAPGRISVVRDPEDGATPLVSVPSAAPVSGRADAGSASGNGTVVPLGQRRHTGRILAAAAAVVLLLVGVTVVAVNRGGGSGTELVAAADLAVLEGGGSGRAELVQKDDGLHLVVDVSDLTPAERADFFELWLLTADGADPQSLTRFEERNGVVDAVVPAGIDTSEFPVVDISEEIEDGDDTHSGKSILRGTLQ
jgi:hypothetical protein